MTAQQSIQFCIPIGISQLAFLDPDKREYIECAELARKVAVYLKRFSPEERSRIVLSMNVYLSLDRQKLPKYNRFTDRVDTYWVEVLGMIESEVGRRPEELEKLVQLCLLQAHGNAFLERGFSATKRIVDGKNSISDESVKAQKIIKENINEVGSAHKVPITLSMLSSYKASYRMMKEEQKKKKEKAKHEKEKSLQAEAVRKRRLEEEENKHWEQKLKDVENNIKECKEVIQQQEVIYKSAPSRGLISRRILFLKTLLLPLQPMLKI